MISKHFKNIKVYEKIYTPGKQAARVDELHRVQYNGGWRECLQRSGGQQVR